MLECSCIPTIANFKVILFNFIRKWLNAEGQMIGRKFAKVYLVVNRENIFFAEIKKNFSINNIIVPNNPLFTKP